MGVGKQFGGIYGVQCGHRAVRAPVERGEAIISTISSAIATGGAGGIGSAISHGLAEAGYAVVVADINRLSLDAVAAELPEVDRPVRNGGDLIGFAVGVHVSDHACYATGSSVDVNGGWLTC